jgi:MEMO1 family protein
VAGLFYADDPDELRMQVLGLLADVAASTKVMPKALIAPHAGYAYSRPRCRRGICDASG